MNGLRQIRTAFIHPQTEFRTTHISNSLQSQMLCLHLQLGGNKCKAHIRRRLLSCTSHRARCWSVGSVVVEAGYLDKRIKPRPEFDKKRTIKDTTQQIRVCPMSFRTIVIFRRSQVSESMSTLSTWNDAGHSSVPVNGGDPERHYEAWFTLIENQYIDACSIAPVHPKEADK